MIKICFLIALVLCFSSCATSREVYYEYCEPYIQVEGKNILKYGPGEGDKIFVGTLRDGEGNIVYEDKTAIWRVTNHPDIDYTKIVIEKGRSTWFLVAWLISGRTELTLSKFWR